jgi:uncharacterized membrane protein
MPDTVTMNTSGQEVVPETCPAIPWYQSSAIRSGIVSILSSLLLVFNITEVDDATKQTIVAVICAIGAAYSGIHEIYKRIANRQRCNIAPKLL